MMMIEDHHNLGWNQTIKEHHGWGQGSWSRGARGQNLKKGGGPGGGPKNRQILHTGGEIWGGVFLGGVPKNRDHKTWSFMSS